MVLGLFVFLCFEVRKQLIDAPESIHFGGGVVSMHDLPEFSSRSSHLGVL